MSIRKMISLHPKATNNQALGDAVHHLMYASKMSMSCADACMAEAMDMTQCIRLCLDCSDICEATARLGTRRTGDDQPILTEDRKSTRLNSSHSQQSRMPSSAWIGRASCRERV